MPTTTNQKIEKAHFQERNKKSYDLSSLNILVAEDSVHIQRLTSSMLKAFGVREVLACRNAEEAIDLLKITQIKKRSSDEVRGIDLVLTDWLMPGGDGIDLIKWIREHEDDEIKFKPIILLSAYTSEKVIKTARDSGANEAMVKPVSGDSLASRILSVIDKPRPFVKTKDFFGPDRRRQEESYNDKDRRVTKPDMIVYYDEKL